MRSWQWGKQTNISLPFSSRSKEHVWWPSILHRFPEKSVLPDSRLPAKTNSGLRRQVRRRLKMHQRSARNDLSFWNLVFDDQLERRASSRIRLLVIIIGDSRIRIETEQRIIKKWCRGKAYILSAQNTEMILLKDAFDPRRPPTIKLQGHQIWMRARVRYLGVNFDTGLRMATLIQFLIGYWRLYG